MDDDRPKKPRKKAKQQSKPPKKKAAPKKKIAQKKKSPADFLKGPDPAQAPGLSALFSMLTDPRLQKEKLNAQIMADFMSEYLSSYILIGYTVDGKPVRVTMARTPQDYDALSTSLQRYIMEGTHRTGDSSGYDGGLPFE